MKHAIPHDLSPETARRAAEHALQDYCERFAEYHPRATWVDERHADISFRAKGVVLEGGLDVNPDEIVVQLDVPLLLRPFRKRAVSTIDGEVRRWIDKARRGELDA